MILRIGSRPFELGIHSLIQTKDVRTHHDHQKGSAGKSSEGVARSSNCHPAKIGLHQERRSGSREEPELYDAATTPSPRWSTDCYAEVADGCQVRALIRFAALKSWAGIGY